VIGVLTCVALGWLASLLLPGPREAPDKPTVYTLRKDGWHGRGEPLRPTPASPRWRTAAPLEAPN